MIDFEKTISPRRRGEKTRKSKIESLVILALKEIPGGLE
jgi:hypothetical protein